MVTLRCIRAQNAPFVDYRCKKADMDKRQLAEVFRARLQTVFDRSRLSQSGFAEAIGIDRSALSLLLSGRTVRLPRVETLLAIAERNAVTIDWLLGVAQDEGVTGTMLSSGSIETTGEDGQEHRRQPAHALACRSSGRQDPLCARAHSRSAAHHRRDRLGSRCRPPEPARASGGRSVPA